MNTRYIINPSDMAIYEEVTGRKLPRTEAVNLIDQLNNNLPRPVLVYMFVDYEHQELKVGVSADIFARQKQLESEYKKKLTLLHSTETLNRSGAMDIEASIHQFLRRLNRGPTHDQEWFNFHEHDVWLIRNILNALPIKAASANFGVLSNSYIERLNEYPKAPDYVAEEVRLEYGGSVYYHFCKEVKRQTTLDDDTQPTPAIK